MEPLDNPYYQQALVESRKYLPKPVGILVTENSEYSDPVSPADQVIIRQNNLIIQLLLTILEKQEQPIPENTIVSSKLEDLSNLINKLNLDPSKPKQKTPKTLVFATWKTHGVQSNP